MNDEAIQDLKQFIASTVHQEISGVSEELKQLTSRIDDVDAKLDTVIEASGERLDNHEKRITKLETKTA